MNLPTYLRNNEAAEQQSYHEELNQTLRDNLSENGYILPSVTQNELTVNLYPHPQTGVLATLENIMPNGTMWYESTNDEVVVKIGGALRKLDNSAYP